MAAEQETPERRSAPTGPEGAAVSRDPGTPDTAPDDANDLQGFHFRRLMRKRSTWLWAGIPTVVVAIALAFGNLLWVPIILVLGLLITTIVCWIVANSKAEDDFFKTYAEQRGLTRSDRGQLPGSTPLLRKGDERKAEEILSGPIGEGANGSIALYTYTDEERDCCPGWTLWATKVVSVGVGAPCPVDGAGPDVRGHALRTEAVRVVGGDRDRRGRAAGRKRRNGEQVPPQCRSVDTASSQLPRDSVQRSLQAARWPAGTVAA